MLRPAARPAREAPQQALRCDTATPGPPCLQHRHRRQRLLPQPGQLLSMHLALQKGQVVAPLAQVRCQAGREGGGPAAQRRQQCGGGRADVGCMLHRRDAGGMDAGSESGWGDRGG